MVPVVHDHMEKTLVGIAKGSGGPKQAATAEDANSLVANPLGDANFWVRTLISVRNTDHGSQFRALVTEDKHLDRRFESESERAVPRNERQTAPATASSSDYLRSPLAE